MGKSNKFDYTNRSNSGPKLGQIIGSALQKEAEKLQKDAERHLQKARKQSTDSSSGGPDAPATTTQVIDLRAPGKDLSDDGVCALLEGLEIALRSGTRQVSLVLVELDLSGNCITTASLARLAPVLELAKNDLKSLNLASNHIKVEADRQAVQWNAFLQGFQGCTKLRNLNLCDNHDLGRRALEIMARVHTAEQHAPHPPLLGEISTSSLDFDSDDSFDRHIDMRDEDIDRHHHDGGARIRGLCSIPYITLHNIGLDDAGAMWLSYVLQDHYFPVQLIPELNGTQSDATTKTVQHEGRGQGVEWAENKALGKEGTQLLEKVEILRRQALLDSEITFTRTEAGDTDSVIEGYKDKRKSIDDRTIKLLQDHRRTSVKSIRTSDSSEHEVDELESARKKIKRAIIAHDGASSVELWRCALNLVRTSRLLLLLAPLHRAIYHGPQWFKRANAIASPTPSEQSFAELVVGEKLSALSMDRVGHYPTREVSTGSKLAVPKKDAGQSKQLFADVSNSAKLATPHKTNHRKGAFGEGNGLQTVNDKLNRLKIRNEDPLRFVKYQEKRIAEAERNGQYFRNPEMPCHLPVNVVEQITTFLTAEHDAGVMNERQKEAAVQWGQRRETLMTEREWLRKDESAQVLMLLDNIDCLAYGQ